MENDYRDLISRNIVQDMMEGVLAIRFDGTISYVNNAAEKILGRERAEMEGKKFATLFFGDEENDEFNQTVLDAIYDSDTVHEKLVPYFKGDKMAQLHVITSVLRNMGEKVGVVIVIGDVTELAELKIRSAEQIPSSRRFRRPSMSDPPTRRTTRATWCISPRRSCRGSKRRTILGNSTRTAAGTSS